MELDLYYVVKVENARNSNNKSITSLEGISGPFISYTEARDSKNKVEKDKYGFGILDIVKQQAVVYF